MKYCALYTVLLPLAYALYMLLFLHVAEQANEGVILALLPLLYFLPALFCCVGWQWIQRRPIASLETVYICFILPLLFVVIANIFDVYASGYDGINTMFAHFILLLVNALCCVGITGVTALVRLLYRCAKADNAANKLV